MPSWEACKRFSSPWLCSASLSGIFAWCFFIAIEMIRFLRLSATLLASTRASRGWSRSSSPDIVASHAQRLLAKICRVPSVPLDFDSCTNFAYAATSCFPTAFDSARELPNQFLPTGVNCTLSLRVSSASYAQANSMGDGRAESCRQLHLLSESDWPYSGLPTLVTGKSPAMPRTSFPDNFWKSPLLTPADHEHYNNHFRDLAWLQVAALMSLTLASAIYSLSVKLTVFPFKLRPETSPSDSTEKILSELMILECSANCASCFRVQQISSSRFCINRS